MWHKDLPFTVSRESLEKLEHYEALLHKWQKTINLVAPSTLKETGVRHFLDSAQMLPHIPTHVKSVLDIGSGAGFPGMVLAILDSGRAYTFIESDQRKCHFLQTVSRETGVSVQVVNSRIEAAIGTQDADIITARALADVSKLLGFVESLPLKNFAIECLFLKGEKIESEIAEAQSHYGFDHDIHPSLSDSRGHILHIRNIRKKSTD